MSRARLATSSRSEGTWRRCRCGWSVNWLPKTRRTNNGQNARRRRAERDATALSGRAPIREHAPPVDYDLIPIAEAARRLHVSEKTVKTRHRLSGFPLMQLTKGSSYLTVWSDAVTRASERLTRAK